MDFMDTTTADILKNMKVKRVISGHQPHTDSPWIMKMKDQDITVITTDTSYSQFGAKTLYNDKTLKEVVNNRGDDCWSEVRIFKDGHTEVQGKTAKSVKFNLEARD